MSSHRSVSSFSFTDTGGTRDSAPAAATTLRRAVERGERTEECIRFDDRLSYAVPPRHTPPT